MKLFHTSPGRREKSSCVAIDAHPVRHLLSGPHRPAASVVLSSPQTTTHTMVHKDYRQEVGLKSPAKTVPKPVAYAVFAAVAAVVVVSAVQIKEAANKYHAKAKPAAAATAPAPTGQ